MDPGRDPLARHALCGPSLKVFLAVGVEPASLADRPSSPFDMELLVPLLSFALLHPPPINPGVDPPDGLFLVRVPHPALTPCPKETARVPLVLARRPPPLHRSTRMDDQVVLGDSTFGIEHLHPMVQHRPPRVQPETGRARQDVQPERPSEED